MVCALYFACVVDTLSKGAENTALVRTRGDKSNWMHGRAEETSLPGLHILCTRTFGGWLACQGPSGHVSLFARLERAKGE